MPAEENRENRYRDANDCLRKASECRQKADRPGEDRLKMLKMAEAWEHWAKIRRMFPATQPVLEPDSRSAPARSGVNPKR
jgi:hypothetical protein